MYYLLIINSANLAIFPFLKTYGPKLIKIFIILINNVVYISNNKSKIFTKNDFTEYL